MESDVLTSKWYVSVMLCCVMCYVSVIMLCYVMCVMLYVMCYNTDPCAQVCGEAAVPRQVPLSLRGGSQAVRGLCGQLDA